MTVRSALSQCRPASGGALGPRWAAGEPDAGRGPGVDAAVPALEVWSVDRPIGGPGFPAAPSCGRPAARACSRWRSPAPRQPPVILDGDPQTDALRTAPLVVTDTPQRREATFSLVRDNYGPVMTAGQPYVNQRAVHDWLPFDGPQVVASDQGVSGLTTSSNQSGATDGWHAVDRDPATTWTSGPFAVGQFLRLTFLRPVRLSGTARLMLGPDAARVTEVAVTTDAGSVRSTLTPDPQTALLADPGRAIR